MLGFPVSCSGEDLPASTSSYLIRILSRASIGRVYLTAMKEAKRRSNNLPYSNGFVIMLSFPQVFT